MLLFTPLSEFSSGLRSDCHSFDGARGQGAFGREERYAFSSHDVLVGIQVLNFLI